MFKHHQEQQNNPRSFRFSDKHGLSLFAASIVSLAGCVSMVFPPVVVGCPYSIRDVGFVDLNSIPYRLYFFLKDDTPGRELATATFREASQVILTDSNVEAEVVEVDKQGDHPAMEYLRFWEIERFPAAILVSPRGHSMVVAIFDPKRPFRETVWSAIEGIVSSPMRDEVMEKIVRAWCVVVLVEGKDSIENDNVRKLVAEAIGDIARSMRRAGRTVEEAPHLMVLSPDSFAEEEMLLWSLGLEDYEARGPRVAVLYGRGRQFGPVLEDEGLTRQSLFSVLSVLDMRCGCDADLSWLCRTQIPHKWGRKLRAEVVKNLGFDPDNPIVKMEVSQAVAWSGVGVVEGEAGGVFDYSEGEITDWEQYRRAATGSVQAAGRRVSSFSAPPGAALASASGSAPTLGKRIGRVMLIVAFGMVLIILGGSALVISRARHKKASS